MKNANAHQKMAKGSSDRILQLIYLKRRENLSFDEILKITEYSANTAKMYLGCYGKNDEMLEKAIKFFERKDFKYAVINNNLPLFIDKNK